MRPEYEQRFRRILNDFMARPGGDDAELLRRGRVVSPPGADIEAWRAEIRAKARADKIRVATIRDGAGAIAVTRRQYSDEEVRAEIERGYALERLAGRAHDHSHELGPGCARVAITFHYGRRFDHAAPLVHREAIVELAGASPPVTLFLGICAILGGISRANPGAVMAVTEVSNFDEVRERVAAQGGVEAFRMEVFRNAAGYGKLGKWVVKEIGDELRRRGLGHTPDPLPADGWATVLVYQLGSEIEKVVNAVMSPSPEGADVLRALASQDASETLMRIRALIEAATAG